MIPQQWGSAAYLPSQTKVEVFVHQRFDNARQKPMPHPSEVNSQSTLALKGKIDFALVTVRQDEHEAVLGRFPAEQIHRGDNRSYSISRLLLTDGSEYQLAVVRSLDQGEGHAQDVARDVIEDLDPTWLVLVGIAGGIPASEFSLGDVVVATRVADFCVTAALEGRTSQLATGGGPMHKDVQDWVALLPAMERELGAWNSERSLGMVRPSVELIEERLYGDDEWRTRVRESLGRHFNPLKQPRPPLVTTGTIASSDTLVKDSKLIQQWHESSRQVVAVEMELAGMYLAARRRHGEYPILAVRGISDIVGFKRQPDWTEYACRSAAALTYALLLTKPVIPKKRARIVNQDNRPSKYALDIAIANNYWARRSNDESSHTPPDYPRLANRKDPPSDLLPYLLDRSEQEKELSNALLRRWAEKPRSPVVCLIHGDELECHADFLRKLRHRSIPNILSLWHSQEVLTSPIAHYELQVSLNDLTPGNAQELLEDSLLTALGIASRSMSAAVSFIHQQHKLAVIINSTLLTQNLSDAALKKLDLLLKFWNGWEELPETLLLFISLDFKYQRRYCQRKSGFFRSRRFCNEDVRTFIRNIDFNTYERIFGFCLPELGAIHRSDLDAVILMDQVHEFYRFKEGDIRTLYEDSRLPNREGRIPMETLIDRLDEIYRQKDFSMGA